MLNAFFRLTRARFKHRCVRVLDRFVAWCESMADYCEQQGRFE